MSDWQPCEICGQTAVNRHHVFGAANRKHSTTFGMIMPLCLSCHARIHSDIDLQLKYKRMYQAIFESLYGREVFMQVFGRSYL